MRGTEREIGDSPLGSQSSNGVLGRGDAEDLSLVGEL